MILYLNNSGSRCISTISSDMMVDAVYPDNSIHARKIVCWESFGNFAVAVLKYKGKTYRLMPCDKNSEGRIVVELPKV